MAQRNIDPEQVEQFVTLFGGCQRRLYLYLLTLLPGADDADDVFQNINLVLWRKFAAYQPDTNFFAWACQIARYEVLDHQRRRARQVPTLSVEVLDQIAAEALDGADVWEEHRQALHACLQKLRDADRQLIEQRYAPGQTGRQLAQRLGRPENSVYLSIGRIRRTLFECIHRRLQAAQLPPARRKGDA